MNKYADALTNAMLVSASEEIDRTHNPKLTKGRIVGISGDNYIVELLGNQYTISSISGAKHKVNETVWVCKPYGENTEQFILGGKITDKTIVGTVLSVNNKEGNVFLDKTDIGLNNVDNTSDLKKPISIETQTALDNKVNNSRVLTDVPLGAKFTDTVYTHPSSHPPSIISQDANNRFVSDTEKLEWNNKAISNPNLLINGDFSDWPRGISFPQDHNKYTTSHWYTTQAGAITRQVNTSPAPTLYHARIMCSSNQAYNIYAQPLENNQIYFNQELTVSFWARGIGGLNSIRVWILKNNLTINLTSTWKKFTFTTTPTGRLSEAPWEKGIKFDTVLMADATKGYEINLVKLELGNVATLFIPRLIGDEIALGQRYYLPTQDLVTSSFTMIAIYANLLQGSASFPTTMRIPPTPKFPFRARRISTGDICTISNGSFLINENGFNTIHQITTDIPLTVGEWYSMDIAFDAEIY